MAHTGHRLVRFIVVLGLAVSMMVVTAGAALAFDPGPPSNVDGLCGFAFPAITKGGLAIPLPNGGPWHATGVGPNPNPSGTLGPNGGPIPFDAACPTP
jgi:hypothetical protein